MFVRFLVRVFALVVAVSFVLGPVASQAQDTALQQDTTLSKEELDQLLAPIALYPDDLLSSVLMASTYPLEVVQASRWVEQPANAKLKGDDLTKALEKQDWDPSIKSLTQFPEVLDLMSSDLEWTQKLGDAVLAQEADVMDQIQFLRDKADEAGNLKSNEQQTVSKKSSGGKEYIYIEPAEPDVVYVPVYEPKVVYGSWWYPSYPPYYWPPPAGGAFVSGFFWGTGVGVASSIWGWGNCNWGGRYININVNKYNRVNVNRRRISSNRWRHNGYHRRGVKYNNNRVRRRHAKNDIRAGRRKRLDYRGHSGKQVLRPNGKRRPGARPKAGSNKRPGRGRVNKAGGNKRPGRGRINKAGDRRPGGRPTAAKRPKRDKRLSAGAKRRPSAGQRKRRSAGAQQRKRRNAFSKPRRRSASRRNAGRGRSSLGPRRGRSRAGARRGRSRAGARRGRSRAGARRGGRGGGRRGGRRGGGRRR